MSLRQHHRSYRAHAALPRSERYRSRGQRPTPHRVDGAARKAFARTGRDEVRPSRMSLRDQVLGARDCGVLDVLLVAAEFLKLHLVRDAKDREAYIALSQLGAVLLVLPNYAVIACHFAVLL